MRYFEYGDKEIQYLTDFAGKIQNREFDLEDIWNQSDEEAIKLLSSLKGIGVWTAEMILLFCMQRPDIFSYDDRAIQRGLRMVYHHRKVDRKLFAVKKASVKEKNKKVKKEKDKK